MNENLIRVYDTTSGAPLDDPDRLLDRAEQIRFGTCYPGGISDTFSCFIPCDVSRRIPIRWCQTLIVRNGLTLVWEGLITNITLTIGAVQGITLEAVGFWQLADVKYKYNRWIDRRYQSDIYGVWFIKTNATAPDKCTYDQDSRLSFVPKDVAWSNNEYAAFEYVTNGSSNIKRVVFDYDFAEAAQAWELRLYDVTNTAALWTQATSGTGTQDITLSTSSAYLRFEFTAKAGQTPASDGTIYGRITDLALVAEDWTGAAQTTVSELMKNCVHYLGSNFADDYTYIAANTYDLLSTGWVEDDLSNSLAKQMIKLGTFSSGVSAYSVGCLMSDALLNNTKPVIYYEAYPTLTDYDYIIRLDEQQLTGVELVMSANLQDLYNNVYVTHRDSNDKTQWANYGDDAALNDATSAAKYLSRVKVISGGTSATLAGAGVFGRPYITQHKDLQYYMRGPLVVQGTIRQKNGTTIPVSHVRAGKRIKIENFISDIADLNSTGLTFLISATEYNDDDNSISITAGVPDDLAIYLARQSVMNP